MTTTGAIGETEDGRQSRPAGLLRRLAVPGLLAVMALQTLATAFFFYDVIEDMFTPGLGFHLDLSVVMELVATLVLVIAIAIEVAVLRYLLDERERMQDALAIARGKLAEILEADFARWGLTAAEREVAWLAIKGFSIAEIAEIRGAKVGTVKAQLGAVYRKAGVSRRAELLGSLVEELLDGGVMPGASDIKAPTGKAAGAG